MRTIPHVAAAMQKVLTEGADVAGVQTGFVQRRSAKLTGRSFTQTLVFGWLAHPDASLDDRVQTAAALGVQVRPQARDQRFTAQAAACLQRVLQASLTTVLQGELVRVPLLQRFREVVVLDCSTIILPDALASLWPGCGGSTSEHTAAARKVGVRLDLRQGRLAGPFLEQARTHDMRSALQTLPVVPGGLRLADLGCFDLSLLATLSEQGAYWLSRLRAATKRYAAQGSALALPNWLATQAPSVAVPVVVGKTQRLDARLLAVRVGQDVADQRRRRLREEAKRKGQMVSSERLALAEWSIFITNVPAELLRVREALVLARARWQVALLFTLWKSHGKLSCWRSTNPWRLVCEVYAKLLALLIQHWVLILRCWHEPGRSLTKAARTVRAHARHLAGVFAHTDQLEQAITVIVRSLEMAGRMNTRKRKPNTYQRLQDPSLNWFPDQHNID